MSLSGRKRASLVLLLVLAAGLVAAGAAAAAASPSHPQQMLCCPADMASAASGCAWLGASDCCPERPTAQAPSNAAPPAPASFSPLLLSAAAGAPAALPLCLTHAQHAPRSSVLRL
jgi:hypothetical protein